MNFTHFHEIFLHQVFIHCNRPNGSKYANTEKTRLEIVFMSKQCINCQIHRKHTFRTCVSYSMNVIGIIITVCSLMSLLQLLMKRVKLHVEKQRKLTLFSWGNTD